MERDADHMEGRRRLNGREWKTVEQSGMKWDSVDCLLKDLKAAILEPFINLREKSLLCLGDEAH